jgi:L-galactose dehydrogenase
LHGIPRTGQDGVSVSAVSFGTAPLGDMFGTADEQRAHETVGRALDAGITFFDSSPYYGNGLAEQRLGEALARHRDQVLIGTKAGRYGFDDFDFSPSRIRTSLEESLRLLRTDYVDVLQLHDIEFVQLEGVLTDAHAELVALREEGKCRFIGMSGYPMATLRRAITETELDVVLSYAHNTLLDQCLQDRLLPVADERGVRVINAAAVALGLLTPGTIRMGTEHPAGPPIRAAAEAVRAVCAEHGVNVSFPANQYAIQRSGCATTLIGTVNPAFLDSAVAAVDAPIDEELLARVLAAAAPVSRLDWISGLPENN